jgi:hypothetical protein
MRRLLNSESDPNRGLGKAFRDRIPLSSPWWDLSDLKRGLDRKKFVSEIAGIQERLVGREEGEPIVEVSKRPQGYGFAVLQIG